MAVERGDEVGILRCRHPGQLLRWKTSSCGSDEADLVSAGFGMESERQTFAERPKNVWVVDFPTEQGKSCWRSCKKRSNRSFSGNKKGQGLLRDARLQLYGSLLTMSFDCFLSLLSSFGL